MTDLPHHRRVSNVPMWRNQTGALFSEHVFFSVAPHKKRHKSHFMRVSATHVRKGVGKTCIAEYP